MLFLGEVEVGLWRGLCEDEVEGQAGSSWGWLPGRSLGLPGGGRKADVALGDAGWCSTSTSTSTLTSTLASASTSAGPPVPPVFHQIKKTLGAPTNFNRCPCRS